MEEKKKDIKPIDFTKIVKKLWPHRKKYYYVLPATLIFTYLFMVCIPRYYECTVSLAPEANGASVSGSISSLASSFGLGGSLAKLNSQDAIYAEIYPEVISSKNFIAELMTIEIKTTDSITCSYYTYLRDKQKSPWWGQVENAITGLFMHPKKDSYDGEKKISVFTLNKQQSEVFASAKGKIRCRYDKKTDIVSIRVQDQDPLVCAIIADSTCQRLQDFIVAYRTNKARIDYEYFQKLCEKSKKDYETALYNYAAIADANRNTVLESYHAKVEKSYTTQ